MSAASFCANHPPAKPAPLGSNTGGTMLNLHELTDDQLGQLIRHGNTPEVRQAAQSELDARSEEEGDAPGEGNPAQWR